MKVGWQNTNNLTFTQAHTWDFKNGLYFGMGWKKFAEWLAEECPICLRVWINDVIVWDYSHGWYKEDMKNIKEE